MNTSRRQRGFTLVELLVTMALVAVLATLATPSLRDFMANQSLSSTTSDLMSSALQARGAALKYNQRVMVQPLSGTDWGTGWRIYVDANRNSTFDSGSDTLIVTQDSVPRGVAMTTHTGTTSNLGQFAYDGDGFLANLSGVTDGTVVLMSTVTSKKKYLRIEKSGRARVCDPAFDSGCVPS